MIRHILATGHRPDGWPPMLGDPYDPVCQEPVVVLLRDYLVDLVGFVPGEAWEGGPVTLVVGCGEGFDVALSKAAFVAVDQLGAPFQVWAGLPWPRFDLAYKNAAAARNCRRVLERAVLVQTFAEQAPKTPAGFWDWALRKRILAERNGWVSSQGDSESTVGVALLDPGRKKGSGTRNTVRMLEARGVPVLNVWDDVAVQLARGN